MFEQKIVGFCYNFLSETPSRDPDMKGGLPIERGVPNFEIPNSSRVFFEASNDRKWPSSDPYSTKDPRVTCLFLSV